MFTWSSSCNFIHVSKTPVGETGALWPTAFNEMNINKGYFYSNTWHLLCFMLFIHYCVSLCWRENSLLLYTCCYSRDILFFSSGSASLLNIFYQTKRLWRESNRRSCCHLLCPATRWLLGRRAAVLSWHHVRPQLTVLPGCEEIHHESHAYTEH